MRSIKRSSLFAFVCLVATVTLALLGVFAVLTPAEARADEAPVGLSLSIERVAGVAYASADLGGHQPRRDDVRHRRPGNNASSDAQVQGRYLGAQLWFGLGGYVL
jgi:hypothetical protein